ncbi:hypothetical protein [Mycolicibacterium fortuitum]|uniref:hypothetical protein n=1 Tax=Mycolicibacterium fortuitum TaxID=1766 RepID=UPI001AEFACE9|nr:hypothetical protein [Mycolicibacterium fortuitum]MBP3083104.1 hypothetical protein [Mycolicibacterium fortuitum]
MCAELTATMIVWPRRCGHDGMVLELVEHHRPYWLARRRGRRVSMTVPAPGFALAAGLALANSTPPREAADADFTAWSGRAVTVLRYAGCVLGDVEVERARSAGVAVEVVDLDANTQSRRGAR